MFDIYSLRTLVITDCVGTGTLESGGSYTVGNNKTFTVWGGTVLNTGGGVAVNAYADTTTTIYGGRIESTDGEAIYPYPGSDVRIKGGTVYTGGYCSAICGHGQDGVVSELTISGGKVLKDLSNGRTTELIEVQDGSFTMTGGHVGGDVVVYDGEGTTMVSGGTIDGNLSTCSQEVSITGGSMELDVLSSNATVSAGTFHGQCVVFDSANVTMTGGNFSGCESLVIRGQTWICGGSYSNIQVENAPLYLSGIPTIESLTVKYPGTVSAQSEDGSGSFGGGTVVVNLEDPSADTAWKDGDIVIKNVTSDAVAEQFVLSGEYDEWVRLERSGDNLVYMVLGDTLQIFPEEGVEGQGVMENYTSGGAPWYALRDQIGKVSLAEGVTAIGNYAFADCSGVMDTITLPEGVVTIGRNAFSGCTGLKHMYIPESVTTIRASS